nr:RNA-directed DNA polymerase, eukaryota [Tanacetum cinerariifolium]
MLKKEIRNWVAVHKLSQLGLLNDIRAKLNDIDKTLDQGRVTDEILCSRLELLNKMYDIKSNSVRDQMQKAKIQWAIEGDENSIFFMELLIVNVFIYLLKISDLKKPVTPDEIRKAVWSCGENKSPGPNGFSFEFFRKFWDLIGPDMYIAVEWFFTHNSFSRGCNASFISLIPKVHDPKSLNDFRPISLIGSLYKVVSKILAMRLSLVIPDLISDVQTAFLPNRHILDGPFIINELISWCKHRKQQAMVFKVDFPKAYDSIRFDSILRASASLGHDPGCALLQKKFKEDLFISCIENGILQDSFEPSNENANVVNAPREPFVVNQDPGKNSSQSPPQINHHCCYGCGNPLEGIFCHQCTCKLCGNGAHYGYNCPLKVPIIPNPEPFNNKTIKELPPTVQSFDPKSDLVYNSLNVFDPPPQLPFIPCEFCRNDAHEFIKSIVENLVPIPSESKGENECDLPACEDFTTFSNILFDSDYDFYSSDDQSFSDEDFPKEIYSNPLFDEEIIPKKIDLHYFNAESGLIESLLNHDSSIISSSKIDSLFDEFAGELTLLKSVSPGIDETDPEDETYFTKRLLYDNSSPRPPKEFVSKNSDADIESFSLSPIPVEDSDSIMEEIKGQAQRPKTSMGELGQAQRPKTSASCEAPHAYP